MGKATFMTITQDAEKMMAFFARVSSKHQDNPEYAGLLRHCLKNDHWSVFEHAYMTIEVETTRAISAQILRHRSFTFQEFSQRYADPTDMGFEVGEARRQDTKNRQNSVDDLDPEIKKTWINLQKHLYQDAQETYEWAIKHGVAKECARAVLPLNTKTRLYITGNIRSWINYIRLRSANGTQKEHQEIALQIKEIFCEHLPICAEALGWTHQETTDV